MMTDEDMKFAGCLVLVTFISALAIGLFIGTSTKTRDFQKAAIQHGVAEYNATNGNWQWKEQK